MDSCFLTAIHVFLGCFSLRKYLFIILVFNLLPPPHPPPLSSTFTPPLPFFPSFFMLISPFTPFFYTPFLPPLPSFYASSLLPLSPPPLLPPPFFSFFYPLSSLLTHVFLHTLFTSFYLPFNILLPVPYLPSFPFTLPSKPPLPPPLSSPSLLYPLPLALSLSSPDPTPWGEWSLTTWSAFGGGRQRSFNCSICEVPRH